MKCSASRRFPALAALLLAVTLSAPSASAQAGAPSLSRFTYPKSDSDFLNPERGFYVPKHGITREGLRDVRRVQRASVIRTYFRLDPFRNSPLPDSFLTRVDRELNLVREAGLKAIVRFAYNADMAPDASLERILAHIGQLTPILTAQADIIAMLEAGFIGAWGEWHSSTHGLENNESRKAVLLKLLSALPPDRMVAVRCNVHKRGALGSDAPLGPEEAFNRSPRARVGAHNDCLGASHTDFGTYAENAIESEKSFLNLDNRYVPQEGETCNPGTYARCAPMLKDLSRMRWDLLNLGYHPEVLAGWKQEGCYPEIQRRLGYRFVLLRSEVQDSARPGGSLRIAFTVTNEGWGKAFNPRTLQVVLREEKTKARYALPLPHYPRRWGPGDTVAVEAIGGIPAGMPPGRYAVFLNLPDPMPRLRNRPEYSIRLANPGLWEDSTGLNALKHSVVVAANAGAPSQAAAFFAPADAEGSVALRDGERRAGRRVDAPRLKRFDLRGRSLFEAER